MLQPKFKKYVTNFTLRMGPLTTVGSLVGVRKPESKYDAGKYVLTSPSGEPVKQQYVDASGKVIAKNELGKAKPVKIGTLENGEAVIEYHPVDVGVVKEIKEAVLPKNVLTLQVHDKESVDRSVFPSNSNGYVFVPNSDDPVNVQMYDVIREGLTMDKAFLGMGNMRGFDTFLRAYLWRGQIVLQKVLFPEDVNDHETISMPNLPDSTKVKVEKMLGRFCKSFDSNDYRNVVKEKLASLEGETSVDVIISPTGAVSFDLDALLEEYL